MTTKLYLICQDIDLGYHVHGVYDNKEQAETKLKECLEAWVDWRFFGEEIPEELSTTESLLNAYNRHQHFIKEQELNSDTDINGEIQNYKKYLEYRKKQTK
jgi:hypothetical protein